MSNPTFTPTDYPKACEALEMWLGMYHYNNGKPNTWPLSWIELQEMPPEISKGVYEAFLDEQGISAFCWKESMWRWSYKVRTEESRGIACPTKGLFPTRTEAFNAALPVAFEELEERLK